MKMKYERPVMRAEAFQANAYCAGCKRYQSVIGKYIHVVSREDNPRDFYFKTTAVPSVNDYYGTTQWYFEEYNSDNIQNPEGTFYLEWSATYADRWPTNKNPTPYFIYQEDAVNSGYGRDAEGNVITKGDTSLQVNGNGGNNNWSTYYDGDCTILIFL